MLENSMTETIVVDERGVLRHGRQFEDDAIIAGDSASVIRSGSEGGLLAEGSRFGAYVIGPCVGHGGMARIYRAEHEVLCRQVALKVLTRDVEPGTEGRARFLREARIAASIKHPNVVNIFDVGVESGIPYLVMELLVGQDLEAVLATRGRLDESTVIDLIVPIVAGLVAVHAAGVVHRDLKPANIFLSQAANANDEVEPKLLDFGISQSDGFAKTRLTSTRDVLTGTPQYMSPEAARGEGMTPASDQYSLGVVLYECTTGVKPFLADTVAETVLRVGAGQFVPISEQAVRPSARLQAIIERAMRLDPSERFPNMRALGHELLRLAGQRTRITWGLTFANVAAIARAEHVLEPEEEAIPLVRMRASRPAASVWPWLVGSLGFAAAAAILLGRHEPAPVIVPTHHVARALEPRMLAALDDSSALLAASTPERVEGLPAAATAARTPRPVESDRAARGALNRLDEASGAARTSHDPSGDGELGAGSSPARGHLPPPPAAEMAAPKAVLPQPSEWITKGGLTRPIESGAPARVGSVAPTPPAPSTDSRSIEVGTNEALIFD
jgi:hypothetical protein